MAEPAQMQIGAGQVGRLVFGGFTAEMDYRLSDRLGRPTIDFSWEGWDEDMLVSGHGWGVLDDDGRLGIQLYVHNGDARVRRPLDRKPSGWQFPKAATRGKGAVHRRVTSQ